MLKKLKETGMAIGIIVLILALIYALSWIITCGLIALICLCFHWTFSWLTATGIWLVILILKSIFSHTTTVKK
jgi:hypothetical protein